MTQNANKDESGRAKISSEKTQIQFEQKMEELKRGEIERITEQRAMRLGLPYINLEGFPIAAEAVMMMPRAFAEEHRAICFVNLGGEIRIGIVDYAPEQIQLIRDFFTKEHPNTKVNFYLVSYPSLQKAITLYDKLPEPKQLVRGVKVTAKDLEEFNEEYDSFGKISEKMKTVNITELVNFMIASAIKARASDIHIEAEEKGIAVRYRIDGLLHDIADLPRSSWKKLNPRIKLLAGLKINVEDVPQDGRFSIELGNDRIDVRVSALPTNFGESIVMRLLLSSAVQIKFSELGLAEYNLAFLKQQIMRPNGMVITTGPTGSGKTTTLYAILNELNEPGVKIITVEDPIEYQVPGINQSQVDETGGYTFANGLKSILRQDPDVIMVGEIRDAATVDIGISAALTGHLVVSTLHTNSAAGAIPRLLSLDAKPFLLAPALNAVIGQRLVRKLCEQCKKPLAESDQNIAKAKTALSELAETPKAFEKVKTLFSPEKLSFFEAAGCSACNNLGYRGRIGIYEIFTMSPDIEKVILNGGASEFEMEKIARASGMITMAQDGILKALAGITSLDEVFRVAE